VPLMKELIEKSDRYHRTGTQEYHAMIIGVPNVGKSSLINMLRSKHLRKGEGGLYTYKELNWRRLDNFINGKFMLLQEFGTISLVLICREST
jgi:ribosome biogenesis GTPase A